MQDYKELFMDAYAANICRPGADKLLEYIKGSDFFTAPASTRYHLSVEGGLVRHSVTVWQQLRLEVENMRACLEAAGHSEGVLHALRGVTEESVTICGLLHDLCKIGVYAIEMRNRKNADGVWEKVPVYTVDDQLPYGHGEKSVYIIRGYIELQREEALAIRWHMGGFDDSVRGGYSASRTLSSAYEAYPLAVLLHAADLKASYLLEDRG